MSDHPPLTDLDLVHVLDDMPESAFIYREDGLLMAFNRAGERLVGVPRELLIGRFNMFDQGALMDPALTEGYRVAFLGRSQIIAATLLRLNPGDAGLDGKPTELWIETTLVPLARRPDGSAAYVLGLQRDVTELLRSRQEIAEARAEIDDQRSTIASLEAARQEIEAQKAIIQALSTPVIEVWDGIITLPLLGHFNAERASAMTSQLLDAVVRTRARYAILDLTGITEIDTATGDHIMRIVSAVGLLGAVGVLVGIQAQIAQMLVGLGVDLGRVRVHQNLRQALKACMSGPPA